MTAPPKWAQDLLIDAALYVGSDVVPDLTWRRSRKHRMTSGYANLATKGIVLTVGSNRIDQKRAVLHEAAHIFVNGNHTTAFWDMAWKLYRWAKLPLLKIRVREGNYMKGSLKAYARSRKG